VVQFSVPDPGAVFGLLASGSFCVEIGCCGPDGITTAWGKGVPANKVTAHQLDFNWRDRRRLTPTGRGDHWFEYGPDVHEAQYVEADGPEAYERVALEVWRLLETRGKRFWDSWSPDPPRRRRASSS
jgi:hypothetical protein